MSNYNTSRKAISMDEFITFAVSNGWTVIPTDRGQPEDEVNLCDGAGKMVVAYPQPTQFSEHIGFRGSVYGLLEVWDEGSLEQVVLEGRIIDADIARAEAIHALAQVLAHYDTEPAEADEVRQELSGIGDGEA